MNRKKHTCSNCGSHDTAQDFEYISVDSDFSPSTFICHSCGNIDNIFPEITIDTIKKNRILNENKKHEQNKSNNIDPMFYLLSGISLITIIFSIISYSIEFMDSITATIISFSAIILAYISFIIR